MKCVQRIRGELHQIKLIKKLHMKKALLFITILTLTINVFTQTIVGTTPENKNAIIEEFTGIACGFCPYGHLEVAQFVAAHPNDGFSIAYHQGFFALPDPGQPDYTTTYGDGLGSYFGLSAWPNAMINRHNYGGGLLYPLNEWQSYASQVLTEGAYVNVACEAEVDVQTRVLTVHVEAYYTGDSPESINYLNVALTQNNVKGPQFSSWFNPDAITPDGEYMHQHMFREFLTGQWGDEISATINGTFIDNYYSGTIPAEINDVPVHLGEIAIVSYISETEEEVANVNGCEPILTNFEYDIDGGIDELIIPEAACSNVEAKLIVGNYGSENITSINFEILVNGDDPVLFNWDTEFIESFKVKEIELPAVFYASLGTNNYTVAITSVNGESDLNPTNNVATGTFDEADEFVLPLTLHLETDNYFGTAWYLLDDQNNVIQQGSGYAYNSTFDIDLDVDAGCYKFIMTDLDGFFFGSYSITDGENSTIVSINGHFGNEEVTAFSLPIYEPTALVDASTTVACIGGEVQFFDASTGGPSSWNWSFEGGDPESSNEKNPVVSYENPGTYDVSLEVTNVLGTDFITVEDYISVTSLSFGNLALEFDGIDDYVEVTNESAFDFTDGITLEAWIKPALLSGTQGVISKNFGNNSHPYQIRLIGNEVLFGFYSNTIGWQPIQTSSANLLVGEWSHIACTYNMSQVKIFVNGIQKGIGYKTFEIPQNDQPLEIGRTKDVGFEYFSGIIDEVRVWNIALDQETIQMNMCTNYTGSINENLIANFKFNECGGTLLTDNQNGYDGILIEMTGEEWIESGACPSYTVNFIITEEPGTVSVEDARINMNGTIRYTDETGEAMFEGYEEGDYIYSVSKDGFTMESGDFEIVDEDITIEVMLLINAIAESFKDNVSIYPNPTHGLVNLKMDRDSQNSISIMITDLTGRIIINDIFLTLEECQIDISDQNPGAYLVQINVEGQVINKLVILE